MNYRTFRNRLSPKVRRELERRGGVTLLEHLRLNRDRPVYLPGMSGLGGDVFSEAEQNAKAAEILRNAPPTQLYAKPRMASGWPANVDRIPKVIQFHARGNPAQLVDIPLDMREGVRQEIVDRYGVPPDAAGQLASQAIDRWIELERRPQPTAPMPSFKAEAPVALAVEPMPANLGELSDNNAQIQKTYSSLGWKQIVPVALGVGLMVLLLKKR